MNTKRIRRLLGFSGCLLILIAIWAAWPGDAQAQCGDIPADSSCFTCHEKEYPVYGTGEWHDIHASKDCCWNCHGGNTQAQDKDLAHEGMTLNPLTDTYTDCYACHPDDYAQRADRFGALLGFTASGGEPPQKPQQLDTGDREDLQVVIMPSPEPVEVPAVPLPVEQIVIAVSVAAIVALFLLLENRRVHS